MRIGGVLLIAVDYIRAGAITPQLCLHSIRYLPNLRTHTLTIVTNGDLLFTCDSKVI